MSRVIDAAFWGIVAHDKIVDRWLWFRRRNFFILQQCVNTSVKFVWNVQVPSKQVKMKGHKNWMAWHIPYTSFNSVDEKSITSQGRIKTLYINNSYQLPTSSCCFPIGFLERLNGNMSNLASWRLAKESSKSSISRSGSFEAKLFFWVDGFLTTRRNTYTFLTLLEVWDSHSHWWTIICNHVIIDGTCLT